MEHESWVMQLIGVFVALAPMIIGLLIVMHVLRRLDQIGEDVQKIAAALAEREYDTRR